MNLKDKSVCVIDTGNWMPFAEKLSESFGTTYYYRPSSENGYMNLKDSMIGEGYENVKCLDEEGFWDNVDDIDLFCFTDCVFTGLQEHLKSLGKLVWGSGKTAWMEQDRFALREWQKKEKMPTPEYKTIVGVENLKDIPPNTFIKVNNFIRGDMESLRHYDKQRSKTRMYDLSTKLGGYADKMKFMVEDKIGGREVGEDGFTVDGKFPRVAMHGVELKDKCYYAELILAENLPQPIKYIREKLAKVFKEEKTRSPFSNEIRVDKKGDAYLTDMTCRLGLPPYQLYLEMYNNLAEHIYNAAQGILVELKPIAKYGCVVMINSDFACDNWMSLKIPKENRQWVKLMNCCKIGGEDWIMPVYGFSEIGAVVGIGKSREESIENCKKHCEGIKGDSVEINPDDLEEAIEEFDKMKKWKTT